MRRVLAIAAMVGAMTLLAVPTYGQAPAAPVISFDLRGAPIEDVLGALQGLVPGFRFVKKPEVKGKVTALMENADVTTALRKVCDEAKASFKLDQGTYIIEAKATSGPRRPPRTPGVGVPVPGRTPGLGGTPARRTPTLPRGLPSRGR